MSATSPHDGGEVSARGVSDAAAMQPMDEPKRRSPTPLEVAKLAAAIDPEACRQGNWRDPLLQALAGIEESDGLSRQLKQLSPIEQWYALAPEAKAGSLGAQAFLKWVGEQLIEPPLILSQRDAGDTMRSYLEEHGNFEGKTGRKSWGSVRTVLDNLEALYVDKANQHNQRNARRIESKERSDAAEAKEIGCTVEELWSRSRRDFDEVWQDGESSFDSLLARYAIWDGGKVIRYEFPTSIADMLLIWKRKIRRTGGIKKVRPLTRDEVFGIAPKQKNPKKAK